MQKFSNLILFKILGWKISGEFPRDEPKYVVIGAPHTSWTDFILVLLIRSSTGIKGHFAAKKSLFNWPFKGVMSKLGGVPIDRSSSSNKVTFLSNQFLENEEYILGISPEGTRKKVKKWKSGFYYVALTAKVPIVKVSLDYKRRLICIDKPMHPTGDIESDFKKIKLFYKGIVGRHEERT